MDGGGAVGGGEDVRRQDSEQDTLDVEVERQHCHDPQRAAEDRNLRRRDEVVPGAKAEAHDLSQVGGERDRGRTQRHDRDDVLLTRHFEHRVRQDSPEQD